MKVRRLATLGALALHVVLAAPAPATAAGPQATVDQEAARPGKPNPFQQDLDNMGNHGLGQTLTVGQDGLLVAADLFLARPATTTDDLVIEIRRGDPGGELLATSTPITHDRIPTSPGAWVHVAFPEPPTVKAGDVIAVTTAIAYPFPDAGPAWTWSWSDAGGKVPDDYRPGVAWSGFWSGDGTVRWSRAADGSDLAFRTWIESGPPAQAVDAGGDNTCAIRIDGTLACWGPGQPGLLNPPPGTFTAVSTGPGHVCAIATDGTLACWGGEGATSTTPPIGAFRTISTGGTHACAIRKDGTLSCWGGNLLGQSSPPLGRYLDISAGNGFTCAVRTDGTLACWGYNPNEQATPPSGTFSAVSAGSDHACAIRTDGAVACWGSPSVAAAAPATGTFADISAGPGAACAVGTGGAISCWGTAPLALSPPPTGSFTTVSLGADHACAMRTGGTVSCWGDDTRGQLSLQPTATITPLPAWTPDTAIPVAWSGTPAVAPIASYDVRYRRTPGGKGKSSVVPWQVATPATSSTLPGSTGSTYCVSARSRDASGIVSEWTADTCTAVPLDDRSLKRSGKWKSVTGPGNFRSTAMRTTSKGAELTRKGVVAKRIGLLATTCPTCGTVKVYLGKKLLRTISLRSDTTANGQLLDVAAFSSAKSGKLVIRVASSGKPVTVDGVVLSRS